VLILPSVPGDKKGASLAALRGTAGALSTTAGGGGVHFCACPPAVFSMSLSLVIAERTSRSREGFGKGRRPKAAVMDG
jgi:hypothetical protein